MTKFNDIRLVPNIVSTIESRSDVNIDNSLGEHILKLPILASPMVDVCNAYVCNVLNQYGAMGFIHRFQAIECQTKEYLQARQAGCAIGIGQFDRFKSLYNVGCRLFIIDAANGAHINVERTIEQCLTYADDVEFIVGNVASSLTYKWCQSLSHVVGVRVGIGTGLGCITKDMTGILSEPSPLLQTCRHKKQNASIIYDGGIRSVSDICKAVALGADFVMIGSMIASCSDSPAQENNGYKIYRGSASDEIQRQYNGREPKYVEGITTQIHQAGVISELCNRIKNGLQSCFSYFNAKTLQEFRNNVKRSIINGMDNSSDYF